jgi:hypothetical protein
VILRAGTAVATIGQYRSQASLAALLIANAIPLVGVLFFGWSLITILVLYWLENGIVGLWNVPRIALARGEDPIQNVATAAANEKLFIIPFFLIHYGIFWLGHGFFLSVLPRFGAFGSFADRALDPSIVIVDDFPYTGLVDAASPWGTLDVRAVAFAGVAMFVSHGVTFVTDYVRRREYLRISPRRQMFAVYGRVIVLHLTILFGGLAIAILGSPIWILVVLVAGKTLFDLSLDGRGGTFATS